MNHEATATRGRILIVDDEMLNRTLLATNLQESGYAVEAVEDGEQALRMLRTQSFDAVLLDLVMPRMDGYEVLAEMKQDAILRRMPVIIISATDEMDSIVRCIEMGATDYLPKPFNPVLLHARIKASLAGVHEERMAALRDQFAQVTAAQEEERQRISQELHDGLVPSLASLNIRLRTARKHLERDGHPMASEMEEMSELAQTSIRDIRRLIHDLRPVALDELGLVPALRDHLARCELENDLIVEFAADEGERLPASVETAFFRIAQEAVNNVLRHALAKHVTVAIERDAGEVRLRVADDGRGFDTELPYSRGHVGLWSMRERVEQVGGQFAVRSVPGRGTTVTAMVPL